MGLWLLFSHASHDPAELILIRLVRVRRPVVQGLAIWYPATVRSIRAVAHALRPSLLREMPLSIKLGSVCLNLSFLGCLVDVSPLPVMPLSEELLLSLPSLCPGRSIQGVGIRFIVHHGASKQR